MNTPSDILERNIERLMASAADEGGQGSAPRLLLDAVLGQVRAERRRRATRRKYTVGALSGLAVAIVAALTVVLRMLPTGHIAPPAPASVGQVRTVYGLATLASDDITQTLTGERKLFAGQTVGTLTGSQAEVTLADASRLLLRPRTFLEAQSRSDGQRVLLKAGQVSVQAARQPPGHSLTIATPTSEITVLGTTLDVHVIQRPDGRRQTRVTVESGRVQLSSGGGSVRLLANAEGIANEGEAPTARAITAEVNELGRLSARSAELLGGQGRVAGPPAVIDFNGDCSATVWTMAEVAVPSAGEPKRIAVTPALACSGLEAYLPEGLPLPTAADASGGRWLIDLSGAPPTPGKARQIVLKFSRMAGIFQAVGGGTFQADLPDRAGPISLLEFRLPDFAVIEEAVPAPLEKQRAPSRQILLLTGELPKLFATTTQD